MKEIRLKYFAALREKAGKDEEKFWTNAKTLRDLYGDLQTLHGFRQNTGDVQVAVNNEYTSLDAVVTSGTSVVFIPPVAGG